VRPQSSSKPQIRTFFWPFTRKAAKPKFDDRMLNVIACPLTKAPLVFDAETSELVNNEWGLRYPVEDGVPILLLSRAKRFTPEGQTAESLDEVTAALAHEQNPLNQPADEKPMTQHTWKP
jgi:uncharacterized protein